VLAQFLTEAIMISLTGGLLGVLLGALGSWGIAHFAGWPAPLNVRAVVPAVLFAAVVGVFFGFYPARKASRLHPVDALRYE
jgi:putative ABC transport system permease protein